MSQSSSGRHGDASPHPAPKSAVAFTSGDPDPANVSAHDKMRPQWGPN